MVKIKEIVTVFVSLILLTLSCVGSVNALVFNGTIRDPNGNPLNGTLINLTMTDFGMGMEDDQIFYNSTFSNASGFFTVNYSSNDSWIYSPVIRYTNTTTGAIQYVGQNIPGFPVSEFSQISDVNFYLAEAGAINVTAINSTGGRRAFNYMILDSKLGSEVSYAWSGAGINETIAYVPKNRNYSITLFPIQGMPINYEWTNFSAGSSYTFSDGLSRYNYTTKTVHKQFNTTENFERLTGYINYSGISGWSEFSIVAFTVQPGNRVSISHSMPYNISSWLGQTDVYNLTNGFYNITLPILAEGGTALLMAVAKNSTYYAGFRNISLASGRDSRINFTLYDMLGENANYSIGYGGQKNITLKMQNFSLVNSTNSSISTIDGFFEISLDYSNYGAMNFKFERDMDSSETLALNFPMLNVTGFEEINVYTQNYAPKRLSKRTASQIISNNNITMSQFNPGDIDGSNIANSISIALYKSNSTCDVPVPGSGCELTSTDGVSNFNPLSVIIGGGALSFRMGLISSGIIVHYVNVDLLASGPPDALFDDSANSSTSDGFDSAMRFGGNGPKVYEYVLVSMPYVDGSSSVSGLNDSAPVNLSIPTFYDENWVPIWTSSNGSNASALAGNHSHYSSKVSEWQTLMNPNNCTTNVSIFNATNPCYINTSSNRIWIRLPHFSGTQPTVSGNAIVAVASSGEDNNNGGSSGSGGGLSTYIISNEQFSQGYTKALAKGEKIKFSVNNQNHTVTLSNLTANSAIIIVNSTPQTATLLIGESKKFDVNDDQYYDLLVKLNSIVNNKANITLSSLYEGIQIPSEDNSEIQEEGSAHINNKISGNKGLISIIVIIILIILVTIIVSIGLLKRKKH